MIARYRSLSRQYLAALCLAAGALGFVALTDAPLAAEPAQAAGESAAPEDVRRSKETLESLRNGGTAMFSWITDAMVESGDLTREQVMAGDFGGEEEAPPEEPDDPQSLAWSRCPAATYEEMRELLVPTYIQELPRTDGWGHELEFCLDRTPADRKMLIAGIRSPGKDGAFEANSYTAGPFAVSAFDRDIVWIDGFFVNWPSRDAGN